MNKQMKIILYAVMAAAAALVIACSLFYAGLGRELRDATDRLAESRATWERIAAEKETLQAALKTKREELKEAELSFTESTEKADKLRSEIAQLKNELESLKQNSMPDQ